MPDNSAPPVNSQTLVVEADKFSYETVDQADGLATVVRFKVDNPTVRVGDVLLVLAGTDIRFHGFIGKLEDDWAVAADRRDSQLPADIH